MKKVILDCKIERPKTTFRLYNLKWVSRNVCVYGDAVKMNGGTIRTCLRWANFYPLLDWAL